MVIPWVIGIAVIVLVARWAFLSMQSKARDRAMEYRIRHRHDLHRL